MSNPDDFYDFFYNVTVIQTVVAAAFVLALLYYFWKIYEVPPGPWGLPFLGYWPFFKRENGHLQLQKFKEQFGDVFSFTVSGYLYICLSTVKAIKDVHLGKSECFGDRFDGYSLLTESFKEAVSIVNGESWRVQRKFFNQKFKEYGMNAVKENTSGSLYDALRETVEEMHQMDGQPIAIADLLTVKCSTIIRRILFNDQGITENELKELNHEYETVIASMDYKNILLMGNFARFAIFPFMPSYRAMIRSHKRIHKILQNVIDRHKLAFDESQVMDIIDCFYKEKRDREKKGDPSAEHFTDLALLSSIYQFVTDGVLTVAFFISLFLQTLVQRPEEQDKIYEELLEVVGPNRQPTIEDKSNLPYTNAFIYEVIRFSDFFPLFPSMKCTREFTIYGHKFPKGAITVLNVWSAHHDPNTYEDPHQFDPSRYMTRPGKQRADLPIMFGIGKRACMGEPFTMLQVFLFLTTIVKNFRLTQSDESDATAMLLTAGEVKICAHPRSRESSRTTD